MQEEQCEFEAALGYITRSKSAQATERGAQTQSNNKTKQKTSSNIDKNKKRSSVPLSPIPLQLFLFSTL